MAKVLIVDDSRTSRKMLRNVLENNGHVIVDEAMNGQEGVQKFQACKPDLVTLDITMPIVDGVEALKMIRAFSSDVLKETLPKSLFAQTRNEPGSNSSLAATMLTDPPGVPSTGYASARRWTSLIGGTA